MMKNSTIKSYFETKNLATTWLPNAKFFMTPAMYNDIYKGMLGEEGGMAILESQGFSVSELSPALATYLAGLAGAVFQPVRPDDAL